MKGFVPTPNRTVDLMVAALFRDKPPRPEDRLLDPGCGTGAFVDGVLRWCRAQAIRPPKIIGVESNPLLAAQARRAYAPRAASRSAMAIFWSRPCKSIASLSAILLMCRSQDCLSRKRRFIGSFLSRREDASTFIFSSRTGSQGPQPHGRLVLITPEKFLYVETASPLRAILAQKDVQEIRLIDEQTFGSLVTYPTVTTVTNSPGRGATRIVFRDGRGVKLSAAAPWWFLAACHSRLRRAPRYSSASGHLCASELRSCDRS